MGTYVGRLPGFRAPIAARTSSETFRNFVRGDEAIVSPLLRGLPPCAIQREAGSRRTRRGRHRSTTMSVWEFVVWLTETSPRNPSDLVIGKKTLGILGT